ncbi:MAG: aspartate kinase [Acidobacteriota bacterium]|nr:aspartate kinase [Acidobacteriota bacterium]
MKSLLVIKFGGTSVGSPEAVQRAASLVAAARGRPLLVVVSALNGVTDRLTALAAHAAEGDSVAMAEDLLWIYRRHLAQAGELLSGQAFRTYMTGFDHARQALFRQAEALAARAEVTAADRDDLSAYGEWFSARLFRLFLEQHGVPATFCEARELLVTDDRFGCARPRVGLTRVRLNEVLHPLLRAGRTVVTQGFVGATADGRTTTLGRGGSDYSATLFAALLEAGEVHIRTDVNGVFSADPKLIPEARRVSRLNLEEAWELAVHGARVLYAPCLEPLRGGKVPLYVRNTMDPDTGGTLICPSIRPDAGRIFVSLQKDGTIIRLKPQATGGSPGSELYITAQQKLERLEAVSFRPEEISLVCGGCVETFLDALDDRVQLSERLPTTLIHIFGGEPASKPAIRNACEAMLDRASINTHYVGNIGPKQHFLFAVSPEDSLTAARLLHDHFHEHHETGLTVPAVPRAQAIQEVRR